MPPQIKFSLSIPGADRIHHINEHDIRVVLSRLPVDLCCRIRAVHFNDRGRGSRVLGYVNRGRREIALCALPAYTDQAIDQGYRAVQELLIELTPKICRDCQ